MYAEAIQVWDQLGLTEDHAESRRKVSQGATIELENKYLIEKAFEVSGNKQDITVINTDSDTIVSTSDYDVDLRDGNVEWSGTDNSNLKIRYKVAPIANEVCVNKLESAKDTIDRVTNTVFGETKQVTESYDASDEMERLTLFNRPVQNVSDVKINTAQAGEPDDFITLAEGRSEDFIVTKQGIEFTGYETEEGIRNIEVSYSYGYPTVPEDVVKLARDMAAVEVANDTVLSEISEGRDDYAMRVPDTFINRKDEILSGWTIQRINDQVPVEL